MFIVPVLLGEGVRVFIVPVLLGEGVRVFSRRADPAGQRAPQLTRQPLLG